MEIDDEMVSIREVGIWTEVCQADSVEKFLLKFDVQLEEIIPIIHKGLRLGMIKRLHRHCIVRDGPTLK